jgi:nitroreductase
MDVFEAIQSRRSVRKYKPHSIPSEDLHRILEAARLAPSAGNRQPWRFILVRGAEKKRTLAEVANNQTFLADAYVIVVAAADPEVSERWCDRDTMIAVEHMVLAATALGYGTCWIGAFNEENVKNLLEIPTKLRVVALVPIGKPDETPNPRPRKEISEIFFEEEYGNPLRRGYTQWQDRVVPQQLKRETLSNTTDY